MEWGIEVYRIKTEGVLNKFRYFPNKETSKPLLFIIQVTLEWIIIIIPTQRTFFRIFPKAYS